MNQAKFVCASLVPHACAAARPPAGGCVGAGHEQRRRRHDGAAADGHRDAAHGPRGARGRGQGRGRQRRRLRWAGRNGWRGPCGHGGVGDAAAGAARLTRPGCRAARPAVAAVQAGSSEKQRAVALARVQCTAACRWSAASAWRWARTRRVEYYACATSLQCGPLGGVAGPHNSRAWFCCTYGSSASHAMDLRCAP